MRTIMADIDADSGRVMPGEGLIGLTHLMYALHGFSALMGVLGPAFVLTAFLTGWPSIIAVIINYVKRGDAHGSFLESHFRWQLRTFWFAVLWLLVMCALLAMTLWIPVTPIAFVGIPLSIALGVVVGIWVLYRIIRGWMSLTGRKPMPV
jgi:uncharacterized membrane protein